MRRLFEVTLITCALVVLSAMFVVIRSAIAAPDIDTNGPLRAESDVYKKRSQTVARGKTYASVSAAHGAYGISVVSGSKSNGAAGHYRNGLPTVSRDARDYTTTARATAWISGHDRQGRACFANASKSSGG
jgi:hypothetical protein